MSQLRLPGMNPPDEIRPNGDRKSPTFWIRRLRVLRELAAGGEHIIRDVELRRGLNVIWAPPHEPPGENALFENGVAGHTAGKTTFCRLVRYVLGERTFAPESVRRRIREKLSSAWVVADVVVDDTTWIIARPLGIGPHPFCTRGGTIAQIVDAGDKLDYQEFLKAINAASTGKLVADRFPATDERVRWEHVLPWLSRDQECRFADFLEWRHTSSDSESPFVSVDDRQFVVRSILGLISNEEQEEQQRNAQLVSDRRKAVEREPLFMYQARTDHGRVCSALELDLPAPSNPLFASYARAELDRLTIELRDNEERLSKDDRRTELRNTLERAIVEQTNARHNLEDLEKRLKWEQGTLAQLEGDTQSSLLATLPPPTGYCMVPMSLAREQHCPLAFSAAIDLTAPRSERTAAQELKNHKELVQRLEAAAADYRNAFATAEASTNHARQTYLSATTAFEQQRGKLIQETARLSQIARLIQDAETAWEKATTETELIKQIDRQINESYSRQEQLRSEIQEALGRFSSRFDYVVRAILGDEVSGRVDTSGRSLSLIVEEHGERDSAAIATVKLLAFDLAALTTSAEGHGSFPRLLIHDGPREADMAPDIYERLFLFVHELEKCFSGEPSFQYIVTTTTPPPSGFRGNPWLRLQLAGVPTEERLLRCDL
jgi:hypothetical protein